jgi:glycosyltransferase involved in cell wall biosynthesis
LSQNAALWSAPVPRRLLVIVHPYPPVPSVGSNRWGAIVKYLRRAGHQVSVVTTGAFGRLPEDEERDTVRTADLMALPWLRRLVGLGPLATPGKGGGSIPPVPGLLTQTVVPDAFLLSWAPMAYRAAARMTRQGRFDCVITSAPSESTHFVGQALRRRGLAWLADFRDGWTFEPYRPPMPTAPQRRLDARLERMVLRRADAVITATRPIAEDFRSRLGVDARHVPNGWDPDLDPDAVTPAPRRSGVTLVHTGKLTGLRGRDPGTLFAGIRLALEREPALRETLRLLVAGPRDHDDQRAMDQSGLDGVLEYVGQLSRRESVALQRSADALVLLTSRDVCEATGKLFEYLAAGRPILALAAGNEAARIVSETGTGVTVDQDDVQGVADAVAEAARGGLARRYAPHSLEPYTYPSPADEVAEAVERAIARRGAAGQSAA